MSLSQWAVLRRASLPAALAATAAASPFIGTTAAHATGTGQFYVHVYDQQTGRGVPSTQVQLIDAATGAVVGMLESDASGNVTFPNLSDGTYLAHVAGSTAYKELYSRADTLSSAGDDYGFESMRLTPTTLQVGEMHGTVTATDNTVNAEVVIYPASATKTAIESGDIQPVAQTRVGYSYYGNDTGPQDWSLKVPGGSTTKYKVEVIDREAGYSGGCDYDYATHDYVCTPRVPNSAVWVGSVSSPTKADDATQIAVPAGSRTAVPTVNIAGGTDTTTPRITGTVSGVGGAPLDEIEANLRAKMPNGSWLNIDGDYTGSDGRFAFDPPAAVSYDTYVPGHTELQCYIYDDYTGYSPWVTIQPGDPCVSGETREQYVPGDYTTTDVQLDSTTKYQIRFDDYDIGEYKTQWLGGVDVDPGSWNTPPAEAEAAAFSLATPTTHVVENMTMTQQPRDTATGVNGKLTDNAGVGSRGSVTFYDLSGNSVAEVGGRRDGTWTAPISTLPPGSYKVRFETSEGTEWYGGTSYKTAVTVTTTVTGAGANLGNSGQNRLGTLSGAVTVPKVTPTSASDPAHIYPVDSSDAWVTIYDANGDPVDNVDAGANGTWTDKLAPGTYYVAADGEAYSSWDNTAMGISDQPMIKKFWSTAYTLGRAKPITVTAGGTVSGLNFTLGNKLLVVTNPVIKGTKLVGKTLTVTPGTWNDQKGVSFSYQWYRGTTKITGATKSSYLTTSKDKGKLLKVVVTAKDTDGEYASGSATTAAVKIL